MISTNTELELSVLEINYRFIVTTRVNKLGKKIDFH